MQETLSNALNVAKRYNPLEDIPSVNIFILNNIKISKYIK